MADSNASPLLPDDDPLAQAPGALPAGTRLHDFEIVSVIGQGGFGIVYLAHDRALDRPVAIKEYMPAALAARIGEAQVIVRSERHAEAFEAGRRSFLNEARLLARFDHPALLKVYQFWEAHGTAYMVMPYVQGTTLEAQLREAGAPPTEAWLRGLLAPLLDALELMHAANCLHRDIAPDNILMLPEGRPLLLDFGAARQVIGDLTHALTVILKTGYAPVEQYGEVPDLRQGPWTDLYALASVIEFALTGQTPPRAISRFLGDQRVPLAQRLQGRYGERFLQAIDQALAVRPQDRLQSVAQLRAALGPEPAPVPEPEPVPTPASGPASASKREDETVPRVLAPARAVVPGATPPTTKPRRRAVLALAGVALLAAFALGRLAWIDDPGGSNVALPSTTDDAAPLPTSPSTARAQAEVAPAQPTIDVLPSPAAPLQPSAAPPAAVGQPRSEGDAAGAAADAPAGAGVDPNPVAEAEPETTPRPTRRQEARERATRQPAGATETAPAAASVATPPASSRKRASVGADPAARCTEIIQRTSLGETLSEEDKRVLKEDCRP